MIFGTVVHRLVLEPERPAFAVKYLNWASKEGKAERERLEVTGLPILSEADGDRATAIRDALWSDAQIAEMLEAAQKEQVMLWDQHGVKCKAKADAIGDGVVIDLKTTIDAAPHEFQRSIATFGYFRQAAHYLDGYEATKGERAKDFIFVAVESQPPHAFALYRLDAASIAAGRLGNFINGELWGRITDVPWGMLFRGSVAPRHPSQLYQFALEGCLLFALLWI